MKHILILLVTTISLFAQKTAEVKIAKCNNSQTFDMSYIDYNEDGVFDMLIINKCGNKSVIKLSPSQTEGKPNIELYKESTFDIRLKNYNHIRQQAYYRIYVMHKTGELGYWEHVMGSHKLTWKK